MKEAFQANKVLGAKFLVVGGAGFVFNYAVLKLCYVVFHMPAVVGEVVAAAAALQLTFALHDRWTYAKKSSPQYHRSLSKRYAIYLTSNTFGSIMTVLFFALLSSIMGHLLALATAAALAMVWNFTVNKIFIWKHQH